MLILLAFVNGFFKFLFGNDFVFVGIDWSIDFSVDNVFYDGICRVVLGDLGCSYVRGLLKLFLLNWVGVEKGSLERCCWVG